MEAFSRRNRCMSALDGVKTPKPQLSRSCSYDPNARRPISALSYITDCSRVVCGRKPAAPGQGQYNKWFIPPSHRLKRSVPNIKLDKSCNSSLTQPMSSSTGSSSARITPTPKTLSCASLAISWPSFKKYPGRASVSSNNLESIPDNS
jgi:hypothetical protein